MANSTGSRLIGLLENFSRFVEDHPSVWFASREHTFNRMLLLISDLAVLSQQCFEFVLPKELGEQKPLRIVTAGTGKKLQLLIFLNAYCPQGDADVVRDDKRLRYGRAVCCLPRIRDSVAYLETKNE